MNHRLEIPHRLLGPDGCLIEPGWATKLIMEYSPFDVNDTHKMRVKEWDYYIIVDNNGYAFATTVADSRYIGYVNSTFFDLNNGEKAGFLTPLVMPMGRLNMPTHSSYGDVYFKRNFCNVSLIHEKNGRRITGHYKECPLHGELDFDIFLHQNKKEDTMVIATPWEHDKTAFYYNQKINCMPAEGYVTYNGKTHYFSPDRNFGTLDWGRGVWPYDNTWYWGSGNGYVNGKRFGYNIGYGFGNTTAASENMIFYDGKSHKIDRIHFEIPENDIMRPWKFVSSDNRFDMDFYPIYDNATRFDALVVSQNSHQVFGRMNGKAVLDDGTVLKVENLLTFAERVKYKY